MGRRALPANVHLLRGNPSKKSAGALLDDVVRPPVAVPPCPKFLREDARAEWRRISGHLAQLGLIAEIDRAALTAYCVAWDDLAWAQKRIAALNDEAQKAGDGTGERGRIWDTPSGYKQISVPMQIRNRAIEILAKFVGGFGMIPEARSRVTAGDPQLSFEGMDKPDEGGWGRFE